MYTSEDHRVDRFDQDMMRRCIEIAVQSERKGEYPYGAVINPGGQSGCRIDQPRGA